MKTKMVTSLFLLFSVLVCINAQQATSRVQGTWKLVSFKYGDMPSQLLPDSVQKVKIISTNSFSWVQYLTKSKVVVESAGGTYELNGDSYIENIVFGLQMNNYLGRKQSFTLKFEDDKMIQSGLLSDNFPIEEVWRKVENL